MTVVHPKPIDKNKRTCCICNEVFFAFLSSRKTTCGKKSCVSVRIGHGVRRHGDSKSRLYGIWCGIKTRCLHHNRYKHFEVCDAWKKYPSFRDWAIKTGYADGLEIDRKDNKKGYSPENCRWATREQQMQNTGPSNKKNKTSIYKGVQKLGHTKKKWRALGSVNRKPKQLGLFSTEIEAAKAYDEWAKSEYGVFAYLNFKEE